MTTTSSEAPVPTRVVLYDAETGERLVHASPESTPQEIKGWVMRWRSSYGARTGHKIRVGREPVPADAR